MISGAFLMREKHRRSFASGCILTREMAVSHSSGAIATLVIGNICTHVRIASVSVISAIREEE